MWSQETSNWEELEGGHLVWPQSRVSCEVRPGSWGFVQSGFLILQDQVLNSESELRMREDRGPSRYQIIRRLQSDSAAVLAVTWIILLPILWVSNLSRKHEQQCRSHSSRPRDYWKYREVLICGHRILRAFKVIWSSRCHCDFSQI